MLLNCIKEAVATWLVPVVQLGENFAMDRGMCGVNEKWRKQRHDVMFSFI
jgi:hypothetical protein